MTLLAAAMAASAAAVTNIAAVVVAAATAVSIPAFNLQVMMTASLTTWPLCTSAVLKKLEIARYSNLVFPQEHCFTSRQLCGYIQLGVAGTKISEAS